jgi:hypothetical protein
VYGQPGATNYVPPSGQTAKTLILVGLILQLIFALIFVLALGALAFVAATFGVFPIIAVFYIAVGLLGFIFLFLVWMFCYKPVREGRYEQAKTPTLIFAILSLITINIIAGVLYLIAYIKLGDAVREQQMPPQGYPGGAPMMAPNMPYGGQPMQPQQPMQPMQPMAPAAAPAPGAAAPVICPKCGKPATFVPQYNRYYCYTDQQYV